MHSFKRIFDFYINSSIHVSLAVVALGWVTCLSLDINVNYTLLCFLFFSTVTGYNFVKYAEVAGLHHRSLAKSLKSIQLFSLFCAIGTAITAFQLPKEVWAAGGILGVITLLYAVPFFRPLRGRKVDRGNLRSISGLKIIIIGMVWSGVTVLLPVINNGLYPYWDVWVVFIQRFLLVLALMIPFEVRDVDVDSPFLKTLPQVVGIKKAKVIGLIWLVLFGVMEFFRDDFSVSSFVTHGIVMVVVGMFITVSRRRTEDTDYFSSFWVEGIPILWLWLALMANYLMQY